MRRDCPQDEEIGKHVDYTDGLQRPLDLDGDAFPCERVDHVKHTDFPAVMGAILNGVVRPDMVGVFRPNPEV